MGAIWVSTKMPHEMAFGYQYFQWHYWEGHWSRKFEYPWVVTKGDFSSTRGEQKVLDAGGGEAVLGKYLKERMGTENVINVDLDPSCADVVADIQNLPFADESFDRVLCVSCLEHVDEPLTALRELWRVLKKKGKLLLTMDVADKKTWNCRIDQKEAESLARFLGVVVPQEDLFTSKCSMLAAKEKDGPLTERILLKVLCIDCVKE